MIPPWLLLALWAAGPPEADLYRFPPFEVARPAWRQAWDYADGLARQSHPSLMSEREWPPDDLRADAAWCLACWAALDWAHCHACSRERRQWLARLRKRLGDDDYYAGRMPPPVPLWRLREIP